jgi:hypothetical protein
MGKKKCKYAAPSSGERLDAQQLASRDEAGRHDYSSVLAELYKFVTCMPAPLYSLQDTNVSGEELPSTHLSVCTRQSLPLATRSTPEWPAAPPAAGGRYELHCVCSLYVFAILKKLFISDEMREKWAMVLPVWQETTALWRQRTLVLSFMVFQ